MSIIQSDAPRAAAVSHDQHAGDVASPRRPVRREDYAHIPGWGADLDRANRPAYPMERTPPRLEGVHWERPVQQAATVEILHSVERPGLSPVFGSTLPPRGVSGAMRRFAFKFSEGDMRHWLVLLMADRVDMVEGVFKDLGQGHMPRIYAETGGRAELKHNPAGAARKALVVTAVAVTAYVLWQRHARRRERW